MSRSPADSPAPVATGPKPRILVVDDQRDSARVLQLQVRAAGLECFLCHDGPSALAFVAENPIDVIILDVMMPQMDGFEVCQRLKALERTRDIPVLFLTAKTDVEDKVHALNLGGHDYLTKPVQSSDLIARLRAALRVKELLDQLRGKLALQEELSRLHQSMVSQHWQTTLGQLAVSLAHEINNPLTIALGMLELLPLDGNPETANVHRVRTIQASLHRAASKLRSLLLIAQSGPRGGAVNLAQMVDDVLALTNFRVLTTKVALKTKIDRTRVWLSVPGDFARALLAIVNNALDAVEGRPVPTVQVELGAANGHQTIRVSDNGPGLDPEIQAHLFEPFFTTKTAPHHGLGLALAREIVEAAGGALGFDSPGDLGGAVFTLSLPETRA